MSLVESVGKDHLILYKSLSDKELRHLDDVILENTYLSLSEKAVYFPVFEPDLSPEYIEKLRDFKERICSVDGLNYSAVLDRNGNELTRQCKQYPFFHRIKQGEYREFLKSTKT